MKLELNAEHRQLREEFRRFADEHIAPHADDFDREERLPDALIERLGARGYLLAAVPEKMGGAGMDAIAYGLLCEAMGRGSGSVANLMTVAGMVSSTVYRFGTPEQRRAWLPRLAAGKAVGAYALTEPDIGSDAANVQTRARRSDSGYVLDGRKKWISFGRRADVFVVFAQLEDQPTAFLVERDTPGLRIEAQSGLLGLRGSMLAGLHLEDCEIPSENLLGSEGVGFALVAAASLDRGRYITACGSVGLAQACLDACLAYTRSRHQFGVPLRDHQLVKAMVTDMIANTEAARLLCQRAGYLYDRGHPDTIQANLVAKYFASRTAYRAASDAVQIHGANGCGDGVPVQRYFRDAKIMEIIEGTTQIHQIKIASLS